MASGAPGVTPFPLRGTGRTLPSWVRLVGALFVLAVGLLSLCKQRYLFLLKKMLHAWVRRWCAPMCNAVAPSGALLPRCNALPPSVCTGTSNMHCFPSTLKCRTYLIAHINSNSTTAHNTPLYECRNPPCPHGEAMNMYDTVMPGHHVETGCWGEPTLVPAHVGQGEEGWFRSEFGCVAWSSFVRNVRSLLHARA